MTETITQLCECSEEMCYCANTTEVPVELFERGASVRWQCTPCVQGRHVWTPGGGRDPEQREIPTGVLSFLPPRDPHGYGLCFLFTAILLVVFLAIGLTAIFVIAAWLWP